mgnify:FL=1
MAATVATIGAGTVVEYSTIAAPTVFLSIPDVLSFGAVGEQGEFIETTPLDATTRKYISGLKTPDDKQINMNYLPGDAGQQAFIVAARVSDSVNMKITYPGGTTAEFLLITNGFKLESVENNKQQIGVVYGKQSGAVAWTVA